MSVVPSSTRGLRTPIEPKIFFLFHGPPESKKKKKTEPPKWPPQPVGVAVGLAAAPLPPQPPRRPMAELVAEAVSRADDPAPSGRTMEGGEGGAGGDRRRLLWGDSPREELYHGLLQGRSGRRGAGIDFEAHFFGS